MSRLHRQTHNRTWARIRREVLDRDGWRCQAEGCGKPGRLEVDHIVPLHLGGTNDLGNLQALCRGCHISKSSAERRPVSGEQQAWRAFAGELLDAV